MVDSLESFDEYLFGESNVSERDRTFLEEIHLPPVRR